ncbi:MAG: aminodeoxychorismate synthase component I [Bacteroidia bacterium]|nr:aminodeoxychorismate synthase component I [Bacteroidia bacterium]
MNELGSRSEPFLFIIDFELLKPLIFTLEEVEEAGILFQVHDRKNFITPPNIPTHFTFRKKPVSQEVYQQSFNLVMRHIRGGNSYLVNLTFPTPVETELSLRDIFFRSQARYKLLVPDTFVMFSPEIFSQIKDGVISSYPMKGTIDASIPNAESILLCNPKELAEHHTIVDLIRNDLNLVAKEVRVEKFRYVEQITTNFTKLLQVSSMITGRLPADYRNQIGSILFRTLPAGSVTGAPKKRTIEIIREAENYERDYYTGVMGYFDGSTLDSGVMIRFIEETPEGKIFKSGGGITSQSSADEEYREMINKVYVPFT